MPVVSTAGPEAFTRIRAESMPGSASITSSTSTSNELIVVPRTTDRPVHCMPLRTWESGIIGSAATAGAARLSEAATVAASRILGRMEAPA